MGLQLKPIERYAVNFLEAEYKPEFEEEVKEAEVIFFLCKRGLCNNNCEYEMSRCKWLLFLFFIELKKSEISIENLPHIEETYWSRDGCSKKRG